MVEIQGHDTEGDISVDVRQETERPDDLSALVSSDVPVNDVASSPDEPELSMIAHLDEATEPRDSRPVGVECVHLAVLPHPGDQLIGTSDFTERMP